MPTWAVVLIVVAIFVVAIPLRRWADRGIAREIAKEKAKREALDAVRALAEGDSEFTAVIDFGQKDAGTSGRMPPKEPDHHRWIATALYSLRETQATAAMRGKSMVNLDHENRLAVMVGCWDCEEPWSEKVAKRRCPANDNKWMPTRTTK